MKAYYKKMDEIEAQFEREGETERKRLAPIKRRKAILEAINNPSFTRYAGLAAFTLCFPRANMIERLFSKEHVILKRIG